MFIEFNFTDVKAKLSIGLPCPTKPTPHRTASLLIPHNKTQRPRLPRANGGKNGWNQPGLFWSVHKSASPTISGCRPTVDELRDGLLAGRGTSVHCV